MLQSTGSRHAGSVVEVRGLSYSKAYGILPDQGSNPGPLHWILNHWTTREVSRMGFLKDHTLKKYVAATAADWTSGVELGEGVVRVLDV